MDRTTDGLEGVFAYMDDLRVGSPDRQTHLRHLGAFFNALATNGLAINLEKCVFAHPGLAAPPQPPQTGYPPRQRAPPQRLDL
jgi:hypothetical protein